MSAPNDGLIAAMRGPTTTSNWVVPALMQGCSRASLATTERP